MLSKEEIKNKINLKDRTKYAIEKSKKIIKEHKEEKGDCSIEVSLAYDMQYVEKYIDQLESDKQKLIEKLEERIRYFEENDELLATTYDNYSDGTVTKRIIDELRRLLLIVKGVENEILYRK